MLARDIMTPDPEALTIDDTITSAAIIMRDRNVGFVPIVADRVSRRLSGVITDRDIVIRCVAPGHTDQCRIGAHMSKCDIRAVHPDADVHDIVAEMVRKQVRRIPIIDDDGRLIGVVSLADLALQLGPAEPLQIEDVLAGISAPSLPIYF